MLHGSVVGTARRERGLILTEIVKYWDWGVTNLYLIFFHLLPLVPDLLLGQGADEEHHREPVHQDDGHHIVRSSLLVIVLLL